MARKKNTNVNARGQGFHHLCHQISSQMGISSQEAASFAETFFLSLKANFKKFEFPKKNVFKGDADNLKNPIFIFRNFGRFILNPASNRCYSLISRAVYKKYIPELKNILQSKETNVPDTIRNMNFQDPPLSVYIKNEGQYYLTWTDSDSNTLLQFNEWIENNRKRWETEIRNYESIEKITSGKGHQELEDLLKNINYNRSATEILLTLEDSFKKFKGIERFIYVPELENCYCLIPRGGISLMEATLANTKKRLKTDSTRYFNFKALSHVTINKEKYNITCLELTEESIKQGKKLKDIALEFENNKSIWEKTKLSPRSTYNHPRHSISQDPLLPELLAVSSL